MRERERERLRASPSGTFLKEDVVNQCFVCACVRACVRACVCVCVRERERGGYKRPTISTK